MIENADKIKKLRQKALSLPLVPGVYIMRDESGEIIYIGKAKRLKNRVVQYFRNIKAHLPKVYQMVIRVDDFEHIVCDSEFEALVLECNLIKQHTPKYNILLKDDKGYHYVKVSAGDFPKISSAKQSEVINCKDGSKFIGPYMSAFAVKQMVDDANKIFRLPTCSRKFPRDFGKKRPCLRNHIGHCSGICTGKITAEEYASNFSEALKFIKGNGEIDIAELERQMLAASEALDFELAARLRDRIFAAKKLKEEQKIFLNARVNCDVVAMSIGERKCCICVIKYRKGRLCDSSQHIFDSRPPYNEMLSQFLAQYYLSGENIPREIYLNLTLEDRALIEKLLCERSGRSIKISTPQKNEKYRLVSLAQNNAAEGLAAISKSSGKEIAALDELARLLSLESPPEYIESYDISNLGDRHIVGGMVVFKNGRPLRSAYKKFTIKDQLVQDDYSAMRQMLYRRFTEYLNSEKSDEGFGKMPDLILLDGGKGHVGAVLPVLEELCVSANVFGMVKDGKHRTRAITNGQEIAISSNRAAFALVSKIQDEVHRYTISFQQNKHKKASLVLSLTQIDGVGKAKATALFDRFKTLKAMREASVDELCKVKGITPALAMKIKEFLEN